MCGSDHAHVNLGRPHAADLFYFALLQYTQQLGLQVRFHVSDLVKKQGATIGMLNSSGFRLHGAGKGPLDIPEQFAFQEFIGDCGTVYRYKMPCLARAVIMNRPGDQFLAGATLPLNKYRTAAFFSDTGNQIK